MVLRGRSSYLIGHDQDSVYLFKINMRGPKPVGKVFSYLKAGYMIYMYFFTVLCKAGWHQEQEHIYMECGNVSCDVSPREVTDRINTSACVTSY
jgi:hypothetical protein